MSSEAHVVINVTAALQTNPVNVVVMACDPHMWIMFCSSTAHSNNPASQIRSSIYFGPNVE